jgi:hypothetical protein
MLATNGRISVSRIWSSIESAWCPDAWLMLVEAYLHIPSVLRKTTLDDQLSSGHPSLFEFWNQELQGGSLTHSRCRGRQCNTANLPTVCRGRIRQGLEPADDGRPRAQSLRVHFEQLFALDIRTSISMVEKGSYSASCSLTAYGNQSG